MNKYSFILLFLSLKPAIALEHVFSVECERSSSNTFSGQYVFEYLMASGSELEPAQSYSESLKSIFEILSRSEPKFGGDLEMFSELVLSEDFSQSVVWERAPFGIVAPEESLEMNVNQLPSNCQRTGSASSLKPLLRIQTQDESGLPMQNDLIVYDPDIWKAVGEMDPRQLSFAVVVAWLKRFTQNQTIINRVSSFLHSRRLRSLSPEQIRRQLDGMGFHKRVLENRYGQLALGLEHSCAIFKAKIYCWGNSASRLIPVPEKIKNPTQLVTGSEFACALHSGRIDCWGESTAPITAPEFSTEVLKIFQATSRSVCAMTQSDFKCWGSYGDNLAFPPREIFSARDVVLEETFGCLLEGDSNVKCWGARDVPKVPRQIGLVMQIVIGNTAGSICLIMESGEMKCFGKNSTEDQYWRGTFLGAKKVQHGPLITCALFENEGLNCWNRCYQNVRGPDYYERAVLPDTDPSSIQDFKVGGKHACVLLTSGVQCWSTTCYGGDIFRNSIVPATIAVEK